jgi:SAM-dependent methyltransferase
MGDLYGDPAVYELAFSFRDVAGEVDALEAWYETHRGGRPRTALELAAGPAAHAIELARRGARTTALDLSAAMGRHARRRAREVGVELDVVKADMVSFSLPARFDVAVTMLDSAGHLLTLDAMVGHLRAVASHLAPGGLYVMEMSHPAELFGLAAPTQNRWRVRRGGRTVEVRWTTPARGFDPVTQVGDNRVSLTLSENGERRVVTDVIALRRWTATELDAAVRLAGGLGLVARHGAFEPDAAFVGGPGEWRMISVLQRVGKGPR